MPVRSLCVLLLVGGGLTLPAGGKGSRAEYAGGTIAQIPDGCSGSIQAIDDEFFVFYSKKRAGACPTKKSTSSNTDKKWIAATWPLYSYRRSFCSAKNASIFSPSDIPTKPGRQQAMIFRVNKDDIRMILVSLEARTGRKIEFQDEEARKAGKG